MVLASVADRAIMANYTVKVFSATTRRRLSPVENRFADDLSSQTSYASFDVALPPNHQTGEIEWPSGKLDPRVSFSVGGQQVLDREAFLRTIASQRVTGDTGVFVHGYNTSFEEGVFRLAQMAADSDLGGTPILFAWPSQAAVTGYLTDKEAATASRDNLAALLSDVAGTPAR